MPWCKTDNGKWGYCAPDEVLSKGPCKDTWSYCRYYKKVVDGTCPNQNYFKKRCAATCNFCSCAVQECQNGGILEACACKCAGAWTGGDCGGLPNNDLLRRIRREEPPVSVLELGHGSEGNCAVTFG
ncbi:hypothetical protein LSAT2_025933 [Lamellibrachia satsuma]|nr:hypothetical protein LSAT2_025933 [Lamellibrachia satsuma]